MNNIGIDALSLREAKIRMDFEKVNESAGKLEDIADALFKLHDDNIETTLSSIRTAWTGEHADTFCSKYDTAGDNVVKTAKNLKATAETIRRMAKNTYDAEMEAIRIARLRTFKS